MSLNPQTRVAMVGTMNNELWTAKDEVSCIVIVLDNPKSREQETYYYKSSIKCYGNNCNFCNKEASLYVQCALAVA
jgi:hypothetical protein